MVGRSTNDGWTSPGAYIFAPEVRTANAVVAQKRRRGILVEHVAVLEDVATVGDLSAWLAFCSTSSTVTPSERI